MARSSRSASLSHCSFSTKEDIAKAQAYNAGNKAYDCYYWEDVIGPLPDMGKGVASGAGLAKASQVAPGAPPGAMEMER